MKRNKLFAAAMSVLMALTLAIPVRAAQRGEGSKTITVQHAVDGQTYAAYQIFAVTQSQDGSAFTYTISEDSPWWGAVLSHMGQQSCPETDQYVGGGMTLTRTTADRLWRVTIGRDYRPADFAAALRAAADQSPSGSAVAQGGTAVISLREGGYYFVDSSLGSLCALDTTDSATLYEKNSVPTLTKLVEENPPEGTDAWGKCATAALGRPVNFLLLVNTGSNSFAPQGGGTGADADYVIRDVLPAGMRLLKGTTSYTSIPGWVQGKDYQESYADGVLTITLHADKLACLDQNTDIPITYQALLEGTACVGSQGNQNTAALSYRGCTSTDHATVYTYGMYVFKYTPGDSGDDVPLSGASFTLSLSPDGSSPLTFSPVEDGVLYRHDPAGTVTEITTTSSGLFELRGLDSGTYYLTETAAPSGYNRLPGPVEVELTQEGALLVNGAAANMVRVENNTGAQLPGTGGVGTAIFYLAGGAMTAAGAVLLVMQQRSRTRQS